MNTNEEKERADFVADAELYGLNLSLHELGNGEYARVETQSAWAMWKIGRAALRAESEPVWMPIETAPKDGTNIIVTNGETVSVGWWVEDDDYQEWLDIDGGMLPEPTLWKPLLTAPQTEPKDTGSEI